MRCENSGGQSQQRQDERILHGIQISAGLLDKIARKINPPRLLYNGRMGKLILSLLVALTASAQTPTIDQSLSMKSVSGAQISPDGRYVAYTVQQANWDDNDFVHPDLDRGDRDRRAIPAHQRQEIEQRAACGRRIRDRLAFTSDRDGKRQIYVIAPAAAKPRSSPPRTTASARWRGRPTGRPSRSRPPGRTTRPPRIARTATAISISSSGDYKMNHLWLVKAPAEIPADLKQLP